LGETVKEVRGSAELVTACTVRVALPSAAVPSALMKMAVIVDVPDPIVVAKPVVAPIVATAGLLEFH
jgi:hypothetical protein